MNSERFLSIYNESRNGTDGFTRHPLARALIYSDGVKELADEGCHWLLDIIGTECVPAMRGAAAMGQITVQVVGSSARLSLNLADDAPDIWTRDIEYTDMPEGRYVFFINEDEPGTFSLILVTEY
jgi:hypothetical protein